MSDQFIETEGGLVNLRHVVRISRFEAKRPGGPNARVHLTTGESFSAYVSDQRHELLMSRIVPAQAGQQIALVAHSDGDVWVSRPVLIGWAVAREGQSPTPILDEAPASNEVILIGRPDGKWLWQDVEEFPSLEAAVEQFKRAAQGDPA